MEKNIPNIKPALKLLLDEMKAAGWTNEAMQYIERAVSCHETLLEATKEALCWLDPDCKLDGVRYQGEDMHNDREKMVIGLYEAIAKAQGDQQ